MCIDSAAPPPPLHPPPNAVHASSTGLPIPFKMARVILYFIAKRSQQGGLLDTPSTAPTARFQFGLGGNAECVSGVDMGVWLVEGRGLAVRPDGQRREREAKQASIHPPPYLIGHLKYDDQLLDGARIETHCSPAEGLHQLVYWIQPANLPPNLSADENPMRSVLLLYFVCVLKSQSSQTSRKSITDKNTRCNFNGGKLNRMNKK